jgi:hypothetical protein
MVQGVTVIDTRRLILRAGVRHLYIQPVVALFPPSGRPLLNLLIHKLFTNAPPPSTRRARDRLLTP